MVGLLKEKNRGAMDVVDQVELLSFEVLSVRVSMDYSLKPSGRQL